jgi:glycosyltransferase involved in cell wall biosynthesis
MKIDFVIPVYNEEQLLEKNILKLLNFLKLQKYNFYWQIKIVINGSNDNSADIAQKISQKEEKIKCLIIKEKGKGKAIREAIEKSLADYVIYMDIDLAVSLENINDLILEIKNDYDLIIGSRLLPLSQRERSWIKDLSSKTYIFLSKIILNHNFSDLQCGFKAIRRSCFNKIVDLIEDNGWFFDTEVLIFFQKNKFKIKEIAVNWSENRYEKRKSKIKLFKDSILFISNLIKLKKRFYKKNKNNI